MENYQTIGLPSIAELANQATVGTTTVMRVMRALEYPSYNEMKKDLDELSINFDKCVTLSLNIKTIHILRLRSSMAPAIYFKYLLKKYQMTRS